MANRMKRLRRLRGKKEARRDELTSILEAFEFDQREGGKHTVFTNGDIMIPIPHERRLGTPYVKIVVKRIDQILNERGETNGN